ncbi:O-antigen ligase family protein [Candidatus Falkowbacteria bacterium]|nr:O-antigen ligase family protein [Candidatus Falkowbacteria bacterium]
MTLKKIIEYGSYLFLFILPWQTRWIFHAGIIQGGTSEYLNYSLYGSDVIALALLLLAGLYFWRLRGFGRRADRVKGIIAACAGAYFAFSIAQAPDRALAEFVALRLALAIAMVRLSLVFAEKTRAAFWLAAGLVLPAWLAVWQFLTQSTFANKWLGLTRHIAAEPGTSVIERYPLGQLPERWLRAYGSFDHPNILGGAMAVGLIFALWLLAEWYYSKEKDNLRLLLYVIIASLSAGLFVSFSRGAWLGLFLGTAISLLITVWLKRWRELRPWLVGVAVIAAIFAFFMVPFRDLATSRFTAQDRLELKSTSERLGSYRQASALLKGHWLAGVGLGNYVPALERTEPSQPAWYYQPVHNTFLLLLSEFGLVGLLMIILILGTFVFKDQLPPFIQLSKEQLKIRKLIEDYGRFDLSITAATVSIGTMMLFDHWWWSLHFGVFLFWAIVSLAALPKKTVE